MSGFTRGCGRALLFGGDTIDGATRAFEVAGRGCLVRLGEDEPHYATVAEIAARLEPHPDATMLLTAVSEAVERYDPSREAVIVPEIGKRSP
jgi:hypothetical protein